MRIRLLSAIFAGAMLFPAVVSAQTSLLQEDFNGDFPPSGWTVEPGPGPGGWHRAPDHGYHPWTDNQTPYALLYGNSIGPGGTVMTSPPVNCEGYSRVMLRCSTNVRTSPGPHSSKLYVSAAGGPYQMIAEYQGVDFNRLETLDISSLAGGEPDVRMSWRFSGDKVLISYWCVDNVSVVGDIPRFDVGVSRIVAPADTVDSGAVVTPEVWVNSYTSQPVVDRFKVEMHIGPGYRDSVFVDSLSAYDSIRVSFRDWGATEVGWTTISSETFLQGDADPDNNIRSGSFFVKTPGGIGSDPCSRPEPAQMSVWPNPAGRFVSLALPSPGIRAVRLYDAGGRLLAEYPCLGRRKLDLDISSFSPGAYFVRAEDQTCRLVIE